MGGDNSRVYLSLTTFTVWLKSKIEDGLNTDSMLCANRTQGAPIVVMMPLKFYTTK